MFRRFGRPSVLAIAVALGTLAIIPAAHGVKWGTLTAYYKGDKIVSGYGTFADYSRTHARTKYVIRDTKRDGNTVHCTTSGYIWDRPNLDFGQGPGWQSQGRQSTSAVHNTEKTLYTKFKYTATGTKARGGIVVCVQMGWPVPDKCSATAYATYDY